MDDNTMEGRRRRVMKEVVGYVQLLLGKKKLLV